MANSVTYGEAECMIRSLHFIPLADMGTPAWKSQREQIEQLNITSHQNAQAKGNTGDDFVANLLVEHEKIPVLIHELLVVDAFNRKVLPSMRTELYGTPTGYYMYVQYEAILMNLFECILFHEDVVIAMDEDASEFLEYCWRNVASLLQRREQMHDFFRLECDMADSMVKGDSKALEQMIEQKTTQGNDDKARFGLAMSSLTCMWMILDKVHRLPLSVLNTILLKLDLPCGMAHVIDHTPWKVRVGKREYKYREHTFQEVAAVEDSLLLCPVEAHCWFTVHFLLCDAECRKKYPYTTHRKEQLARIRRFLHEILLDQIPALADVMRALDEMSFLEPPSNAHEKFRSTLVVEPVPRLMSAVTSGLRSEKDYETLSHRLRERMTAPEAVMDDAMRISKLFDGFIDQ